MKKQYMLSSVERALGVISRRRQLQRELKARLAAMTPQQRIKQAKLPVYTGSLSHIS